MFMKASLTLLTALLISLSTTCFAIPGNANAKPTGFIENKGQVTDQDYKLRNDIQFKIATQNGLSIFIGNGAMHYQFVTAKQQPIDLRTKINNDIRKMPVEPTTLETYRMDVALIGANTNARVLTENKLDYYENHYTAFTGSNGVTAHSYSKITYQNIYPNIDWVLYMQNGQLKHEFVVRAGGDVAAIQLKYSGATSLNLNKDGSLTATTPKGTITELAPRSYTTNGEDISSSYRLENNILSYTTGNYNGTLIIDPNIEWATYYGGSDQMGAVKSANNSIYITGNTTGTNIITSGTHQQNLAGAMDGYLVKFNTDGIPAWGTYFGGQRDEVCTSTDVDASGNIYVGGYTWSDTGIATTGAFAGAKGNADGMLIKFDNQGLRIWGRYIAGDNGDYASAIACNSTGVYVTGTTYSQIGISTPGTHKPVFGDGYWGSDVNVFLVYYNSAGTQLMGTYMGSRNEPSGHSDEYGNAIATDLAGNAYVAGYTRSDTGIASGGSYQPVKNGDYDGFISKFNVAGIRLWSTYYGGNYRDELHGIAVANSGDIYAVGRTSSTSGIATSGCHQSAHGGGFFDGIVMKLDATGTLQWATYYGGAEDDELKDLDIDVAGNLVIGGTTASTSNIATAGSYQPVKGNAANFHSDNFFAIFDASGTRQWGSYFGGYAHEAGCVITTDNAGNIYMAGGTDSDTGLATPGSYQPVIGSSHSYLAKFSTATNSIQSIGERNEWSVYPNPTDGFVYVKSKTNVEKVELFDVTGRKVLTQAGHTNSINIDVHHLTPGIYLLKVNDEYTTKIVKQ